MYRPPTLVPQTVSVSYISVESTPPLTCSVTFQPAHRGGDSIFGSNTLSSPVVEMVKGYDRDQFPRIILVVSIASVGSAMYCVRNDSAEVLCGEFETMFQAACTKAGIVSFDINDLTDTLSKSVLCLVSSLTRPFLCTQFVAESMSTINHLCGNSAVLGIHYQYDKIKNNCVIDVTEIYSIDAVTAIH